MAFDIEYGTFEFLSVAKMLYDNDLLDKVLETCGNMEVCEDFYSIAWEGINIIFETFKISYNENRGIGTMVFFDPVITEFYWLCGLYESENHLDPGTAPFRQDGEGEIYQCFNLSAYDYDVLLYDGSHGKSRLVILYGEEFYGESELPEALLDVKNTFASYCKRLKDALTGKENGTAEHAEKEAA